MTDSTKTDRDTSYTVLVHRGDADWTDVGSFRASTAEQARRKAAETNEGETFVAIPARSFRPKTRKTEQFTKESWS